MEEQNKQTTADQQSNSSEEIELQTIESPEPDKDEPGISSYIWDFLKVVVVAFVVMLLFRFFIAEPYIVSGSSMVPNFHDKEYLIVSKIGYRLEEPKRGDVIVFRYPKNTKEYYIKRIIGLPGEQVRISDGRVVIINKEHPEGFVVNESYLDSSVRTYGGSDSIILGSDEFFVLGDNRPSSSDSRNWGVLPRHNIIGRAAIRVLPIPQFGLIHRTAQ